MPKLVQPRVPTSRGRRYSLRTLFIISAVVAVPFLVLANLRHTARPEESVASPLYLLIGIAGVVLAAAVGSALGGKLGQVTLAGLAALSWIAVASMACLFSNELHAVLPAHVLGVLVTLAVVAVLAWRARESQDEGPHGTLLRLLRVKQDVRLSQQEKKDHAPDVEEK